MAVESVLSLGRWEPVAIVSNFSNLGPTGVEVNAIFNQQQYSGRPESGIIITEFHDDRGCPASNPHPHCQIWATASIPVEPAKELAAQSAYWRAKQRCLLCDYVAVAAGASRLENRSA